MTHTLVLACSTCSCRVMVPLLCFIVGLFLGMFVGLVEGRRRWHGRRR